MGIKVAFTGTHRVGKTTEAHKLVYELRKKGINAFYLPETIRNINLSIFNITPIEARTQVYMLHKQITEEMELEKKYDVIVCDRSIFDTYIYYLYAFGRDPLWEKILERYMTSYHSIFFLPMNKKFNRKDNLSVHDDFVRQAIEDILLMELENNHIVYEKYNERKAIKRIVQALR